MLPNYVQRAGNFNTLSSSLHLRYERLGWLRLLVFTGIVAIIILAWSATPWWSGALLTVVGIAAFAGLIRWHSRIQTSALHQQRLADINSQEALGLAGDYRTYPTGSQFTDPLHPYSYDLDLFGDFSLFQMINRGQTSLGQAQLAQWLLAPSDTEEIVSRQTAAQELSQQLEWQHELRALGTALQEEPGQIARLQVWLKEDNVVLGHALRQAALWLAPLLFVLAMVLWATVLPWFAAFTLLIPAGLWLRNSLDEVQKLHNQTSKATHTLQAYSQLMQHIETHTFTSPLLLELQSAFTDGQSTASRAIKKLAYRVSQLDVRYNAFVFILEFSMVWDLQQAYRLDKWKETHRDQLPNWFAALGKLEALVSLGNLHLNQADWSFPTISSDRFLAATALGHPLLPAAKRISNDVSMPTDGHMHLVTGSNMAGKSTWLRSMGTNIVLALAGAPVCAKKLQLTQLQVYTSMRTQDALHESTSSFYAELKRLKFIIEAVEDPSKTAGRPVFFLLDEILKGTNSRDRHAGSKALIRQLIASRGAGIIATHDLELGELEAEAQGQIENWAIEVAIHDGQLYFDYKLKRGVSQSFNATLLMQQMGIKVAIID